MIAAHLLVSVLVALASAGLTLVLQHSIPMALGAYALGGVLGLLGSAALQLCLGGPRENRDAGTRDTAAGMARRTREAPAARDAAQVVHVRRVRTAEKSWPASARDPRLQPAWAHTPACWSDPTSEALCPRRLDG